MGRESVEIGANRHSERSEESCFCGAMHGASRPLTYVRGDGRQSIEELFNTLVRRRSCSAPPLVGIGRSRARPLDAQRRGPAFPSRRRPGAAGAPVSALSGPVGAHVEACYNRRYLPRPAEAGTRALRPRAIPTARPMPNASQPLRLNAQPRPNLLSLPTSGSASRARIGRHA